MVLVLMLLAGLGASAGGKTPATTPGVNILCAPGERHTRCSLEQGRGGRAGGGPPPTGRAAAPEDLTGYWVSVVTEHWHLRMLVPPKGDYSMLPLNPEGRK